MLVSVLSFTQQIQYFCIWHAALRQEIVCTNKWALNAAQEQDKYFFFFLFFFLLEIKLEMIISHSIWNVVYFSGDCHDLRGKLLSSTTRARRTKQYLPTEWFNKCLNWLTGHVNAALPSRWPPLPPSACLLSGRNQHGNTGVCCLIYRVYVK